MFCQKGNHKNSSTPKNVAVLHTGDGSGFYTARVAASRINPFETETESPIFSEGDVAIEVMWGFQGRF